MTTYLRTRLSVKLIGATLLFLGTVALLSTWFTVDILREVFGEQAEAQGRSIARAASIFSVEPLLIEDYPVLETYVEQMVEAKNDVAFVRVYRADGRLAAEATTSTLGTSTVAAFEADVRVSPDDPNTVGRVEIGVSTARSDALVRSHSRNMGIASATAFLVLGLLMFALLRRTVLHPLKSLDAQAVSLGAGDLETPIGLLSIDELGRLAQTLNAMRTNLKLSYEEVQAQNEELKELDRLKDEFLANVTHELKTPLNGVLGLTGAIRDGAYGDLPTPLHGPLAAVNSSAERLLDLSDQILTFSKQSDQTASVEHHEIELGAYLECVAGQFRLESEQKRLRLGVTAPADLVIHTDPNLRVISESGV